MDIQATKLVGGQIKLEITSTLKDEAGNDYQVTKVEIVTEVALLSQKAMAQKMIDTQEARLAIINEKLAIVQATQ